MITNGRYTYITTVINCYYPILEKYQLFSDENPTVYFMNQIFTITNSPQKDTYADIDNGNVATIYP